MTDSHDLGQLPARDGLRLLVEQFTATPHVVVVPVLVWLVVYSAVLTLGAVAVVLLVSRHPDAALPPEEDTDDERRSAADLFDLVGGPS